MAGKYHRRILGGQYVDVTYNFVGRVFFTSSRVSGREGRKTRDFYFPFLDFCFSIEAVAIVWQNLLLL